MGVWIVEFDVVFFFVFVVVYVVDNVYYVCLWVCFVVFVGNVNFLFEWIVFFEELLCCCFVYDDDLGSIECVVFCESLFCD